MEQENLHWHLEKRISVSHIVVTAGMVFSVVWYAAAMENRISLIEQEQRNATARVAAMDKAQLYQNNKLGDLLESIRLEGKSDMQRLEVKFDDLRRWLVENR